MAGEKFVGMMLDIAKNSVNSSDRTDILYGQVTSANPLRIKVDNRIELDGSFFTLSPFCQKFETKVELPPPNITVSIPSHSEHTHKLKDSEEEVQASTQELNHTASVTSQKQEVKLTLWEGLNAGDSVMLLRYENGQKFYVLQKV